MVVVLGALVVLVVSALLMMGHLVERGLRVKLDGSEV